MTTVVVVVPTHRCRSSTGHMKMNQPHGPKKNATVRIPQRPGDCQTSNCAGRSSRECLYRVRGNDACGGRAQHAGKAFAGGAAETVSTVYTAMTRLAAGASSVSQPQSQARQDSGPTEGLQVWADRRFLDRRLVVRGGRVGRAPHSATRRSRSTSL
jgi:hypothetical protein